VEKHTTNAPILEIAMAISNSPFLLCVHMSDNGLRSDEELFLEVIEMFGLDQDVLQPIQENSFVDNKRVQNTSTLKSIIK